MKTLAINPEYITQGFRFTDLLNNTVIIAKVAVVTVATITVSTIKTVTGSFGTSRFSKMTNNMARSARMSTFAYMPLVAAFEIGYLLMTALLLLVSGGSLLVAATFVVTAFVKVMVMSYLVGVTTFILISTIDTLYSSVTS